MPTEPHPVVRAAAEALAGWSTDAAFVIDQRSASDWIEVAAVAAPAVLLAAADLIEATYPPDVFLPDSPSPDARAAAGARVACNRMRHLAAEIERGSQEGDTRDG